MTMDGRKIFDFAIRDVAKSIKNTIESSDIQLYDDINLSLPEIDDAQTVVTLFEQQVEATPNHVLHCYI